VLAFLHLSHDDFDWQSSSQRGTNTTICRQSGARLVAPPSYALADPSPDICVSCVQRHLLCLLQPSQTCSWPSPPKVQSRSIDMEHFSSEDPRGQGIRIKGLTKLLQRGSCFRSICIASKVRTCRSSWTTRGFFHICTGG